MRDNTRLIYIKKPEDIARTNKLNIHGSKVASHFISTCPYSSSLKLSLRNSKKNAIQHIFIDSDWHESLKYFLRYLRRTTYKQSVKSLVLLASSSVDFDEEMIKCLYHFTNLKQFTICTQSNYRISQQEFLSLTKLVRSYRHLEELHLGIHNFSSIGSEIKNCIRRIPRQNILNYLGVYFPRGIDIQETFETFQRCKGLKELNITLDGLIISDSVSSDMYDFFQKNNHFEKLKFSITYGNPKLLKIFENFHRGKLNTLVLKFQRCEDMCHHDVDALVIALVSNQLKTLKLNFSGSYITDFSMRKIGKALGSQRSIEDFHLNVDKTEVTDHSLTLVSKALEEAGTVKDLNLSINYCFNISSLGFLGKTFTNLPNLQRLSLAARKCQNVSDETLEPTFSALCSLSNLKTLSLELSQISNITDNCCWALVNSLKSLIKLEKLALDLYHWKITSKGLEALPCNLLRLANLEKIALNFGGANTGDVFLNELYSNFKKMKKLDAVHIFLNNREGTEENKIKQSEILKSEDVKLLQFFVYMD